MIRVLLDNCAITKSFMEEILPFQDECNFFITSRSNAKNDYRQKYPWLNTIGEVARWGHSIWGSGEVWAPNGDTVKLTNDFLAIGANQKNIEQGKISIQTSPNQRDDADIIICAITNQFDYLVSEDKKFILLNRVVKLARENGLCIANTSGFALVMEKMPHGTA